MKRRHRLIAFAVAILLIVGGFFGIRTIDRTVLVNRAVTDGVAAFNNRDWPKAEEHYTTAIRKLPESEDIEQRAFLASVYYRRGIVRFEMGKLAEVIDDCTRAIELRPAYSEAYLLRAVTKLKAGERAGAEFDFDEALRSNNKSSYFAYCVGLCAEYLENHQKALDHHRRALEISRESHSNGQDDRTDARYHAAISRVLAKIGDESGSEKAARTARDLEPNVAFELPDLANISRRP